MESLVVPLRYRSQFTKNHNSSTDLNHCRPNPSFHRHRRRPLSFFLVSSHRRRIQSSRWSRKNGSSPLISKLSSSLGIVAALIVTWNGFAIAVSEHIPNSDLPVPYLCENVEMYYSGTEKLEGDDLLKKLNSVVSPHRSLRYKEVWNAIKFLDAADFDNPEASSEVIQIYSLKAVSKTLAGKAEGWNREHLWPRSFGLRDGPSLTDLHNIRPADANVNSSRGNKYFGECLSRSTKCIRPATAEASQDTETDKKIWGPPLQVRGDIARSVMYMAVSYGSHQHGGTHHLRLSDTPNSSKREMGLLSVLLKWNEMDPPSREEKLRNERICRVYQHNRNPFVDHPEYAKLIWKVTSHIEREQQISPSNAASMSRRFLGAIERTVDRTYPHSWRAIIVKSCSNGCLEVQP